MPFLPQPFVAEAFDFYGKTLNGTPQIRDRWKRGITVTNVALGDAVGKLYVARYFTPAVKGARRGNGSQPGRRVFAAYRQAQLDGS